MKGVYLTRRPFSGSRYKYEQMFRRVCNLDTVFSDNVKPRDLRKYDFAIVEGDRCTDFRKAVSANLPYLLIQQDTWSIRAGLERYDAEQQMVEGAACILFTAEKHAEWMAKRYKMPKHRTVHLRPLLSDLDFKPLRKLKGRNIAYAGGIVPIENANGRYGYRAYHPIFKTLIDAGWSVHIYPAWGGADRGGTFADIGCVIHDEVPQADIYRELSQYQLVFQGYAETGPQEYIKGCMPNKLWEGLAAGVPILGYNTGAGGMLYTTGGWGTYARTLDKIPVAAERALEIKITQTMRKAQVIDKDIDTFRELIGIMELADGKRELRLGVDVVHGGLKYPKGSRISRSLALKFRDAGLIAGRNL